MSTYERFKTIVDEIDTLISKGVSASSPDFQAWKAKAERFLIKQYGQPQKKSLIPNARLFLNVNITTKKIKLNN